MFTFYFSQTVIIIIASSACFFFFFFFFFVALFVLFLADAYCTGSYSRVCASFSAEKTCTCGFSYVMISQNTRRTGETYVVAFYHVLSLGRVVTF